MVVKRPATLLRGTVATVLFIQANSGAYLSSIRMKNSEYITLIQKIGTGILIGLSLNFFKLHVTSKTKHKKVDIDKSKPIFTVLGCPC